MNKITAFMLYTRAMFRVSPLLGQIDLAIADLNHALTLDRNADYFLALALLYKQTGETDLALNNLNQSLQLKPCLTAYTSRAFILIAKGQFAEALSDYNSALALEPNYWEIYLGKAAVLAKIGQWQDCISACDVFIEHMPKHAQEAKLYKEEASKRI